MRQNERAKCEAIFLRCPPKKHWCALNVFYESKGKKILSFCKGKKFKFFVLLLLFYNNLLFFNVTLYNSLKQRIII